MGTDHLPEECTLHARTKQEIIIHEVHGPKMSKMLGPQGSSN